MRKENVKMRVDLDGFENVEEAREAAMLFLRETASKKKLGPLRTYADSYAHTKESSTKRPRALCESLPPLVRLWKRISGDARS
jgi:hypothetical protein